MRKGSEKGMNSKPIRDYDVGYGKPPVATRFKKGRSGNPRGRPRRSRNIEALTEHYLDNMVTIEDGGERRQVSKRELGLIVLIKKALAGNARATRMIYKILQKLDPRPPAPPYRIVYVDKHGKEISAERLAALQSREVLPDV